jgi:hypothetical protein
MGPIVISYGDMGVFFLIVVNDLLWTGRRNLNYVTLNQLEREESAAEAATRKSRFLQPSGSGSFGLKHIVNWR